MSKIGSFFKKGVLQREFIDVNELVREMIVLLFISIPSNNSVDRVVENLKSILQAKGVTLFARTGNIVPSVFTPAWA